MQSNWHNLIWKWHAVLYLNYSCSSLALQSFVSAMNIQMRHDVITLYNYSCPWWWQGLLGRQESQTASKPVQSLFSIFFPSPWHCDTCRCRCCSLESPNDMQKHNDSVWMESINEILWMSLRKGKRKSWLKECPHKLFLFKWIQRRVRASQKESHGRHAWY